MLCSSVSPVFSQPAACWEDVFTPSGFSQISKKTVARSSAIFGTAVHTSFPHTLWKFRTQVTHGQVTRSRQVISLKKKLNVRHSYTEWPITLQLSAINIRTRIYETYITEFRYRWPKVRSILRPLHYSQWEKNERRLFCTKSIQKTLKHWVAGRIDILSRNIVTGDPSSCCQGHFRSWKSPAVFRIYVTFDKDQLEQQTRQRLFIETR